MFKSNLGLGLGSAKKSDLNAYLKTLEKKNKEVQRKFSATDVDVDIKEHAEKPEPESGEDSDLLSIQKEFEDEFDSPFIKKNIERRQSAIDEIPAETDVPFYNSLAAPRTASTAGVGTALNSFMKYDKKWRGGVSVKVETDTESEPVITEENSVASPVKIAEELEKKTFTQQRRRRQSSSGSAKMTGLTPSPRAKSVKSDSRLRVSVAGRAGRRASVSPPGTGHTPIPTATLSEMSEAFLSPRSPLFDIANVLDISEVLEEEDLEPIHNNSKSPTDEEESSEDDRSRRLSDLIIDSIDLQKNVEANHEAVKNIKLEKEKDGNVTKKKTQRNPFHFNSSRLKSSTEKSDSEPKKPKIKVSNKKRNEIMDSHPPSVNEEVRTENEEVAEDSESETLKEVHEKKPRKKWNVDTAQNSQPIFNFPKPPLPQESSFESSCYYCRHVCKRHQSLIANESVLNVSPKPTKRHEEKAAIMAPPSLSGHGVDVGVQVGKPTIHHYLFDPTQDAVFEDTFPRPEYPRSLHISENQMDLATGAVIDLMRRQLELTQHQLQSQKTLYRSFCKSLEKTQSRRAKQEDADADKILIGKSRRPVKLTFDEALKQVKEEMRLEKKKLRDEKKKSKSGSKSYQTKSDVPRDKPQHDSSIGEMLPSASGVGGNYETDFEEDTEIRTETFQSSS